MENSSGKLGILVQLVVPLLSSQDGMNSVAWSNITGYMKAGRDCECLPLNVGFVSGNGQ